MPRGDDLGRQRRPLYDLLAREEERGGRAPRGERVEHGRRAFGMRAVVEGQPDRAAVVETVADPERAAIPGEPDRRHRKQMPGEDEAIVHPAHGRRRWSRARLHDRDPLCHGGRSASPGGARVAEGAASPAFAAPPARHRPRWLLGTGLALVGWIAQVGALLLIPLTLVEPALAMSLVVLLGIGSRVLGRAGRAARDPEREHDGGGDRAPRRGLRRRGKPTMRPGRECTSRSASSPRSPSRRTGSRCSVARRASSSRSERAPPTRSTGWRRSSSPTTSRTRCGSAWSRGEW